MEPVVFDQVNKVFTKPESMTDEQCSDLPTYTGRDSAGMPVIISAWRLSDQEKAILQNTGVIYLTIVGQVMPPVSLQIESPFDLEARNQKNGNE